MLGQIVPINCSTYSSILEAGGVKSGQAHGSSFSTWIIHFMVDLITQKAGKQYCLELISGCLHQSARITGRVLRFLSWCCCESLAYTVCASSCLSFVWGRNLYYQGKFISSLSGWNFMISVGVPLAYTWVHFLPGEEVLAQSFKSVCMFFLNRALYNIFTLIS